MHYTLTLQAWLELGTRTLLEARRAWPLTCNSKALKAKMGSLARLFVLVSFLGSIKRMCLNKQGWRASRKTPNLRLRPSQAHMHPHTWEPEHTLYKGTIGHYWVGHGTQLMSGNLALTRLRQKDCRESEPQRKTLSTNQTKQHACFTRAPCIYLTTPAKTRPCGRALSAGQQREGLESPDH